MDVRSLPGIAPGAPGIAPTWASSDKDFVTTAVGASRLWATIGHGVLNEVYWPSTGSPQMRDMAFGVLHDGALLDLKRLRSYTLATPAPHIPLLTVTHTVGKVRAVFEFLPDPSRDALLVRYDVTGGPLAITCAPRLGGTGHGNTALVEDGCLHAVTDIAALAIASSVPFMAASAGYVGRSDGWRDLVAHGTLRDTYARAENGNVALTAVLPEGEGVFVLGFAPTLPGARTHALSCLAEGFAAIRAPFVEAWQEWGEGLDLAHPDEDIARAAALSATMLKIHEDRTFTGAIVASLSVPWGNTSDSSGGYHLVWPRDATLSAFALIAAGLLEDARRVLAHLIAIQTGEGGWAQCAFPNGTPYWTGEQLDEVAMPVLLAAKLREMGVPELIGTHAMVRAAVRHLMVRGPISPQDRWEENEGFSPFSLAAEIAALVAAAPWLDAEERAAALDVADERNERIEEWCAAGEGEDRYYVRIGPPAADGGLAGIVPLRNRWGATVPARDLYGLEYAALVRLGLRPADDPVIRATTKRVDETLGVQTPNGRLYYRYNGDGYGEHADGSAFDGNGVGRAWPLLAGERGHLALQSGKDPLPYLLAMVRTASPGGLMPEQVWESAPIPSRELEPGRPAGSAMPLLWAHAEFVKLVAAERSRRVVERLAVVAERYSVPRPARAFRLRSEVPVTRLPAGRALVIEDEAPFSLRFGFDGWGNVVERAAEPGPFGLFAVRLEPEALAGHRSLEFTRRFGSTWEGRDWRVDLVQEDESKL